MKSAVCGFPPAPFASIISRHQPVPNLFSATRAPGNHRFHALRVRAAHGSAFLAFRLPIERRKSRPITFMHAHRIRFIRFHWRHADDSLRLLPAQNPPRLRLRPDHQSRRRPNPSPSSMPGTTPTPNPILPFSTSNLACLHAPPPTAASTKSSAARSVQKPTQDGRLRSRSTSNGPTPSRRKPQSLFVKATENSLGDMLNAVDTAVRSKRLGRLLR